ncbi:hypothetical protein [Microbacterium gorillae]|uniref:hypothetical protein n=1 Tax=Microbacterium gorillae TaxID=1231063 RepID=UPI003D950CC9
MNTTRIKTAALATLIALTGTFGLAACSTDSAADAPASSQTEQTEVDVAADLEGARQAIEDALETDPSWTQVMLAGDVTQPTQKYGMLVMPFVKSDAAKRVTGTVAIADGKYVIEAVSAESGKTWQIDQDGTITEAAE